MYNIYNPWLYMSAPPLARALPQGIRGQWPFYASVNVNLKNPEMPGCGEATESEMTIM